MKKPNPAVAVMLLFVMGGPTGVLAADPPLAVSRPHIADCRIGFDRLFKVGNWTPVWIELEGSVPDGLFVELTVGDNDGVPTTVVAPAFSGQNSSTLMYVKVGRLGSPLGVRLTEGDEIVDRRTFELASAADGAGLSAGLPSTSHLFVVFGTQPIGLAEAIRDVDLQNGAATTQVARLSRVDQLPTQWFGYEGVDLVVLSASDVVLFDMLAADEARCLALRRWVNLGGRVAVVCGRDADELLKSPGLLADLVPGGYADTIPLAQTRAIEQFAETESPLAAVGQRLKLPVPRLTDVTGRIEAFAGARPTDLPLVVRAARGLGEVVFVGIDLDGPPLADWPGRAAFVRALVRPYMTGGDVQHAPQKLSTLGYNDLAGALRQRLGRSFRLVSRIPFAVVALLAIGYLLVLGPLDYLLVNKMLGRPMLAWVTFPLIVLATSGGAYWYGQAAKGRVTRVNQIELIDVALTTSEARGTFWSALYSPRAQRFDLGIDVRLDAVRAKAAPEVLFSWMGLPGAGLGGMESARTELDDTATGYRFSPQLNALLGLPIRVASAKSLLARWQATVESLVDAQLAVDAGGRLTGVVTNQSDAILGGAQLYFRGWAYRLGNLAPGQRIELGPAAEPVRAKTLLMRDARGGASAGGDAQNMFAAGQASLDELLTVMMFYDAAGGYGFAGLQNSCQQYCDLSRLLDLDRAILVARYNGPGSRLVDRSSGGPVRHKEQPTRVVYRFVVPVQQPTESDE